MDKYPSKEIEDAYNATRAKAEGSDNIEIDEDSLIVAHVAVEDVLVGLRDSRVSVISRNHGFVIKEKDGTPSNILRLATAEGLAVGIKAYLAAQAKKSATPRMMIRIEDSGKDYAYGKFEMGDKTFSHLFFDPESLGWFLRGLVMAGIEYEIHCTLKTDSEYVNITQCLDWSPSTDY